MQAERPGRPNPSEAEAGELTGESSKEARGRTYSLVTVNFWLDTLALVAVTAVGIVSTLLIAVFPAPTQAAGWSLCGWPYDTWFRIQFGAICTCAVVLLVHVMLHWNWVCNVLATKILKRKSRPDDAAQTIYGVATLAAVLHVILFITVWAVLTVKKPVP